MKDKEKKFIENHLLLAAVYVDPRYKVLLPAPVEESKEKAKTALKRVVLQLLKLKNEEVEQLKEVQALASEASLDLREDCDSDDESDDKCEKVLDKQEKSQSIKVQVSGFNIEVNLLI